MHNEAHAAVARMVQYLSLAHEPLDILDCGGRQINGDCRDLFHPDSSWTVLDHMADDGVDIVADAADWEPPRSWDVVISTECFEHALRWPEILTVMFKACRQGGHIVLTMATEPRDPHSAIDGGGLRENEEYSNVDPELLRAFLQLRGGAFEITTHPRGDLYAWARQELAGA